ncbi:mannose-6-phosphate isomerase, class I [Micromonospora inyonensis]|uniref:mannose-6-phosphate isomerase n=1 Tax=Micromonospora inyonensis TaxID=47866 RepID=A0A1C6S605_9ACTN|nr:mannose-6-phosphate isomerase, class I [Micromonospora inyonensis]SCL24891.1 mannose-6-phosphate isomerase, type 1 [Micromonospora inyonensis]
MQRILGVTRHYDWGSPTAIPAFLGDPPDPDQPVAEVWFGAHEDAPSPVADSDKTLLDLVGDRLPFLVKLLAPARSVSLQVHPEQHLAEAGFREDEAWGIPRDDPRRRFKDPVHKPEMVFALTPFTGLVGFRPVAECVRDLDRLDADLARRMRAELTGPGPDGDRRRRALQTALGASADEVEGFGGELPWLADLAEQYPGDAGVAAAVLLRRFVLAPGEVVFVPSGMIHAYSSGLALEVMANSDTVLRAGLTTKLVDVDALMRCVNFDSEAAVEVSRHHDAGRLYTPAVTEFALLDATAASPEPVPLSLAGQQIALCVEGPVELIDGEGRLELGPGQAAYLADAKGLSMRGPGRLVLAGPGRES